MSSTTEIDKRQQIITAAHWQTSDESVTSRDAAYDSFIRLMLYRRTIARQYLREQSMENQDYLLEMLDRVNQQIKQILGL